MEEGRRDPSIKGETGDRDPGQPPSPPILHKSQSSKAEEERTLRKKGAI